MEIAEETLRSLLNVAKAYGMRSDSRKAAVAAKAELEEAQKWCRAYGGYEDCGSSYVSAKDEAEGAFRTAVSRKVHAERAYKKARLTAIERHPEIALLIESYVHADPAAERAAEELAASAA